MKLARRDFFKLSAASALTGTAAINSTFAHANQELTREQYKQWFVFDGLAGLYDLNASKEENEKYKWSLSPRLRAAVTQSGLNCTRLTIGTVYEGYPGDNVFEESVKAIATVHKWVSLNSDAVLLVQTSDDLLRTQSEGKLGLTLTFQNSQNIGKDLDRIDTFRDLGVKTMQLTYNGFNRLGGGANVSEKYPLTEFGHQAVEKMNESRVIIDLSHSGRQTCLDAIKASKSPITISHSGCRALVDFPRNKTDEEMRLLADKGGLFGLYFMPFLAEDSNARLEHLIAHIEHAINVCGEEHIALGSDGSLLTGVDDLEKVRANTAKFTEKRMKVGAAAAGEKIGNLNFLPDLVGPDMFLNLANALLKKGHSMTRVEKILGANALRFNQDIWG